MSKITTPFQSFVMAGFECTYAKAEKGRRFDLLAASKHDAYCQTDYQLIKQQGITTVREGLSWSQIDQGNGRYDFSRFLPMLQVAKEQGIEQLWDLNHFDFPEYLDPFSDDFSTAYARYAKECVRVLRTYSDRQLFISPLNEPSFFSWMCDRGLWAPYAKNQGPQFKRQLVKAAIAAMDACWEVDSSIAFLHPDPYMYRTPMHKTNIAEKEFCDDFNTTVRFESWDLLSGKRDPQYGGDPKYLQFIGMNYYFYNQQMVGIDDQKRYAFRSLALTHKRRLPLSTIITQLRDRYGAQILLSETGSYRKRRVTWWTYILNEVRACLEAGIPILGVCSYPTLDIMKGAGFIVPQSGLWDFDCTDKTCQRYPHEDALQIIRQFIDTQPVITNTPSG